MMGAHLGWIIPLAAGLLVSLVGWAWHQTQRRIDHIDECLHRIENARREDNRLLHDLLRDVAEKANRLIGKLDC